MFSWIEIYIGMDYKEFTRIMNLMESNQIRTKTKLKNINNRMTNDVILGGSPLVLNSTGMNSENEEYKIMVKKENVEKARYLISRK